MTTINIQADINKNLKSQPFLLIDETPEPREYLRFTFINIFFKDRKSIRYINNNKFNLSKLLDKLSKHWRISEVHIF